MAALAPRHLENPLVLPTRRHDHTHARAEGRILDERHVNVSGQLVPWHAELLPETKRERVTERMVDPRGITTAPRCAFQ